MKAIVSTLVLLLALTLTACNAQAPDDAKPAMADQNELHVYYFHYTKRCATCNAVENETRAALEMYYGDQIRDGEIAFASLNLEKEEGKEKAEQLKVAGQALVLVKGEQLVNLTNEGFMNARTNSAKFHDILKTQIEKMR